MKSTGYRMNLERPWRWGSLGLGLPARPEVESRIVVSVNGSGNHPREYNGVLQQAITDARLDRKSALSSLRMGGLSM